MKILRFIAVVGLLATILPAGAAVAAPADPSSIPTLAGTTTVVGSESAYARVRLPKSVNLQKTYLEFAGGGRALGVVLTKEVNGRVPKNPSTFEGIRFGDCFEEGCPADGVPASWGWSGKRRAPGIYRLYLIADGAPASVTITFPQLEGETTIAPSLPSQTIVENMTPWVSFDVTQSVYSAGDIAPFRGSGVAWMWQTIEAPGTGTAVSDYCIYWDDPPVVEATAYLPTECPGGMPQHRPRIREYQESREEWLGSGVAIIGRLPAALGNWYATTTPVDVGGSVAIWFKF